MPGTVLNAGATTKSKIVMVPAFWDIEIERQRPILIRPWYKHIIVSAITVEGERVRGSGLEG